MPAFTDHKIAAGWNNAGSLTKVGLIVATSNIAFPEPSGAQGGYNAGTIKQRMDLQLVVTGFNREQWMFNMLTYPQYRYLQTTYFAGGFSGKLTIRTRWQENSYANYNCVGQLAHDNLQTTQQGYLMVGLTLLDLVAI